MKVSFQPEAPRGLWQRRHGVIAILALVAISIHLLLRFAAGEAAGTEGLPLRDAPLIVALILGGVPLVFELLLKAAHRQWGSDLLAGISIITAVLLGQYLAGSLVVLMLSGGEAMEAYAVRSASSVLDALARRMPSIAHLRLATDMVDVPLDAISVGQRVVVFPHEICPVERDGDRGARRHGRVVPDW